MAITCPNMLGQKAPAFTAETTMGTLNFPEDCKGSWVIFFSYPADFTPICTTEVSKFALMQDSFAKASCTLLALSTDSKERHGAWQESLAHNKNMPAKVSFPIIADDDRSIARQYGMIQDGVDHEKTIRAVIFIDPNGIIRALMYYPMANGRSIQEIKRLLLAMQESDKENVITPVDWQPGEASLTQTGCPLSDEHAL